MSGVCFNLLFSRHCLTQQYSSSSSSSRHPAAIDFPVLDSSPVQPKPQLRPPHLPFRRISLPTAPTLVHRQSIASVASFESLPEEQDPVPMALSASPKKAGPSKGRPTSMDFKRSPSSNVNKRRIIDEAKEAKRRKVILEFYETEKAYVDGLELIYSHFLTPIIASLDTPNPLLDRSSLTSVFSNFIDIWNLHRSFYTSLRTLLDSKMLNPPSLSPILLSHFPYLSLYTPFVTAFPDALSAISKLTAPTSPGYNPQFAQFVKKQESDPKCAKLSIRDWLLTIVQRCPRYLLLLKDLIQCTSPNDPEHAQLTAVHTLVSKITLSLNTSLHTHAQTLALLALQRATPNLPFQLIEPGRTLLKRGGLIQVEQRSPQPREREFLLFSDRLIWLATEESEKWRADWWTPTSNVPSSPVAPADSPSTPSPLPQRVAQLSTPSRPPMTRTRSKSDAELPVLKAEVESAAEAVPSTSDSPTTTSTSLFPPVPASSSAQASLTKPLSKSAVFPSQLNRKLPHRSTAPPAPIPIPQARKIKRHASTDAGAMEEKWVYKGKAEVVDLEVVIIPSSFVESGERRMEILSPEGSFVLYATSEEERDEWASAIRHAKAQLLVSLNITHPNTTLTSSSSTNHLRRTLQALPFPPSDDRIDTVKAKGTKKKHKRERRGKVEHWVPAIWIPDGKTEGCMRCGRTFGWRRRRHHCRLCGRCVCASCSGRVFFINDPSQGKNSSKPARACNACYDAVFPLLDTNEDSPADEHDNSLSVSGLGSSITAPSLAPVGDEADESLDVNNTLHFLTNFPAWLSMPSLPLPTSPQALMALDRDRSQERGDRHERVRLKSPPSRPRSSIQILEDFEDLNFSTGSAPGKRLLDVISPLAEEDFDRLSVAGATSSGYASSAGETARDDRTIGGASSSASGSSTNLSSMNSYSPSPSSSSSRRHTTIISSSTTSPSVGLRKENTARRNKRLSMPAVALQTTVVTARTRAGQVSSTQVGGGFGEATGPGKSKRFSLVLGTSSPSGPTSWKGGGRMNNSNSFSTPGGVGGAGLSFMGAAGAGKLHSLPQHPPSPLQAVPKPKEAMHKERDMATLGRGEAAGKLSELLSRSLSGGAK